MTESRRSLRHDAASQWAGEPFLHADEDPQLVLVTGSARQLALESALAEIDAGQAFPSSSWRVRFGLLLGLERVLSRQPVALASGLELRPHQVDALAGLLTELIAMNQATALDEPANGINGLNGLDDDIDESEDSVEECVEEWPDPGRSKRFRFRHPTASGKTVAAAGFVEAADSLGVLVLTHRRLLVDQFRRDLAAAGYQDRLAKAALAGAASSVRNPLCIQTYAWFTRHVDEIDRDAYQLVICDEAHTALGTKTAAAIRSLPEPIYVGMTATEELIAKSVSEVFPASVDDLPLKEASRRGLVAPLRCLRVPPVAAISSVPVVGGEFDQAALAMVLDHEALNLAAASLYRDRFGAAPGIVYAAGVDHAYHLARAFRAAGLKAEAVSGRTPPVQLAETLAAYEQGKINVLINAQLLAEGWNSPRATVCMHLAPTASRRVYQQRIGRVMRTHPRKEAGVVVDFVAKAATNSERAVTLHSLLDADFYREGARATPASRRRLRRARRWLSPAPWLVPVTSDPARRKQVIDSEWTRIDPRHLAGDEASYWAHLAGRRVGPSELGALLERLLQSDRAALNRFLSACAAENPDRQLRLKALGERLKAEIGAGELDELIGIVTQAPLWSKDRLAASRLLLMAIASGQVMAPEHALERWTWRLAATARKVLDARLTATFPAAKSLLGAVANSKGRAHDEQVSRLVTTASREPAAVAAALLAVCEAYTPRSRRQLDQAREALGANCAAAALATLLPAPSSKSRRRKRGGKRNKQKTANAKKSG